MTARSRSRRRRLIHGVAFSATIDTIAACASGSRTAMPTFDGVLTDGEIAEIARYARQQNGWD